MCHKVFPLCYEFKAFTYMLKWLFGWLFLILFDYFRFRNKTMSTHPAYCCYSTMICGADSRTAIVVITVKAVKVMRQNRSITIAANFQSLIMSNSSSCIFMRFVINLSSFKIHWSSRLAVSPEQVKTLSLHQYRYTEKFSHKAFFFLIGHDFHLFKPKFFKDMFFEG